MAKKEPKQTIESKIKEYNKLLVSQDNPERLAELKREINYFNYGITILNHSK